MNKMVHDCMIVKGRRAFLEQKAARILAESMQKIIAERNRVLFAVPGGRSVGNILRQLAQEPVDWSKVHVFMVDERLVPAGHPQSNFRLVASCVESFINAHNLHPFLQNCSDNRAALKSYTRLLQECGGRFDIVLLSSGEDGHIASLFPEHETIFSDEPLFLLTEKAPKPPPARMSASKKLICSSQMALLLFFGEEKRQAFEMYADEQVEVERCPAKIVGIIPQHYVLTDLGY